MKKIISLMILMVSSGAWASKQHHPRDLSWQVVHEFGIGTGLQSLGMAIPPRGTDGEVLGPESIFLDTEHSLWIGDTQNGSVKLFNLDQLQITHEFPLQETGIVDVWSQKDSDLYVLSKYYQNSRGLEVKRLDRLTGVQKSCYRGDNGGADASTTLVSANPNEIVMNLLGDTYTFQDLSKLDPSSGCLELSSSHESLSPRLSVMVADRPRKVDFNIQDKNKPFILIPTSENGQIKFEIPNPKEITEARPIGQDSSGNLYFSIFRSNGNIEFGTIFVFRISPEGKLTGQVDLSKFTDASDVDWVNINRPLAVSPSGVLYAIEPHKNYVLLLRKKF